MAWLNARSNSFLLRSISSDVKFRENYVGRTPIITKFPKSIIDSEYAALALKSSWIASDMTENCYTGKQSEEYSRRLVESLLAAVEGQIVHTVFTLQQFGEFETGQIVSEIGIPAGWYPLIGDYDCLPDLPADLDLPPLPQAVHDFLAGHERIAPNAQELARIKANLQAFYEAGPGARTGNLDLEDLDHHDEEDEGAVSGAYIPIPTETFLEELSVKLQIHPISVYWLLEDLRAEGVRCKPEEQRLLEDRLTVIVLRLLGHRWPKQIEAGEPVPAWADRDGVIPLSAGAGEAPWPTACASVCAPKTAIWARNRWKPCSTN